MKKLCDLFNRYRDGTLALDRRMEFEAHLANCRECQPRLVILNTMVNVIRNQELQDSAVASERIADLAFSRTRSWDVLLLSWLKPAYAWSGLAIILIAVALFWGAPAQQLNPVTDYEELLVNGSVIGNEMANLNDAELEIWLEQGGVPK